MNVILLHPKDVKDAKNTIMENNSNRDKPVFVVTSDDELCDYIPKLELKEKVQSRMLICKEMKINVMLIKDKKQTHFTLFSDLLRNLDASEKCTVVVLGDINVPREQELNVRYELCGIIQQFIYLNIQLSAITVCTEKEARDNEKIQRFQKDIEKHKSSVAETIAHVNSLTNDRKNYKATILGKLNNIQQYISETQNNELKIAVTASKKSGKSVIVNSMINCEIAPTSLELATPNNCIYRKSPDKEYHLKYVNEKFSSPDPEAIRSKLLDLFIGAGKNYKKGLGIPDMNLYYPEFRSGFSSYTVYDTPGPDLAGAEDHTKSALRAVDEADVLIFTIDYSKYLTDSEYDYLVKIWKLCREKGKNYSLILNVNKLDLRYDDNGDKCVTRIVDFIRNKLIKTGEKSGIDFRGCVVIGTSALTYFNSVCAPELKCPNSDGDCRKLLDDFTDDTLKKCILSYDDSEDISAEYEKRAISILQQLRGMIDNAEVWHKQEIADLEDMKKFSGMPNLLSYVDYIATQKARNEKVNNLLFKISSESAAINNLFHIEELVQRLSENKELLERAKNILEAFEKDVKQVMDPDYEDLFKDKYLSLYSDHPEMQSEYLVDITKKYPIKLDDVITQFDDEVEKHLELNAVLDEVTKYRINTLLTRRLYQAYGDDESKVVDIDAALVTYEKFLSEIIKVAASDFVEERKAELSDKMYKEQSSISKVFTYIWAKRLDNMSAAIKKHSDELEAECSQQLNIELPEFLIVIGKNVTGNTTDFSNFNTDNISRIIAEAMKKYNRFNEGTTDGLWGFLRKLFGAEKRITLKNIIEIYEKEKLGYDIEAIYKKNGNLEEYLKNDVREPMSADMSEFIGCMKRDIDDLSDNIMSVTYQIKDSLDEREEYKKNLKELEEEKKALDDLKKAVQIFSDCWSEVTNS